VTAIVRLLDHPQAIEARLCGLGLRVRRDGIAMSLPELYSRVLDVDARDDVLVHAQIVASPGDGLQLSLRGYFDAQQWAATLALLESVLDSLHVPVGRSMPTTVRRALRDAREIRFSDDGCAYAVCFPEREPDADSSLADGTAVNTLVDVTLGRALDIGEWQAWLAEPPLADLVASDTTRKEAAIALCRARLHQLGHALADVDLQVLSAMGNAAGALFTVLAPAHEAVMFCELGDDSTLSISLVDAQGRQTTL
jgi:hypothetical protein